MASNPKTDLSHTSKRDKAEQEERAVAMITGSKIKEHKQVADNPAAHKEYVRLMKIMRKINKDDSLYEAQVNRMAELAGEIEELRSQREKVQKNIKKVEKQMDKGEGDFEKLNNTIIKYQKTYIDLDKQIMKKREMLNKLETTNCFTVSTSNRTVNTKLPEDIDPVAAALLG